MADTEETKEREKEVNVQMEFLDESVADLAEAVERLEPSLSEVMSASKPRETEDKGDAAMESIVDESLCTLAEKIREIRYRIKSAEENVSDKLERIEV